MEIQEYPKALYLSGQQLVVEDAAQEETARADGYDDWHADHERTNDDGDGRAGAADDQPLDRDALKAEAEALGLTFASNIKTDKLAALVAAAKA
jgi:hypothetical protein